MRGQGDVEWWLSCGAVLVLGRTCGTYWGKESIRVLRIWMGLER